MKITKDTTITIGKLAKAAGVGVETVRFYQRKGLLETPQRTSGFRKYTESDIRKIKFIKRVQELGFTLKDAEDLLGLAVCSSETRPRLRQVCNDKIDQIQSKIADLNRMVEMLHQFSQTCGNENLKDSSCSLLSCFENDWECCKDSNRREKDD
ncbi:MAG: MerR family transcriptional regulator [Planctomycetota bacterium]